MGFRCGCCGEVHEDLPRYTMWRVPELSDDDLDALEFDDRFTCHVDDERHFISCEVEVAFPDPDEKPLGFIGWVEVSPRDYARYAAYRGRKKERGRFGDWVEGRLANPVPAVPDSLGTRVRFEVLKGDPTPYVKWVEPGSTLAQRIEQKATPDFWHAVHGLVAGGESA